jgi:hypothetical protein
MSVGQCQTEKNPEGSRARQEADQRKCNLSERTTTPVFSPRGKLCKVFVQWQDCSSGGAVEQVTRVGGSRPSSPFKADVDRRWADGRHCPNDLTHANIMDGTIKYKTPRKNKLQLLCGNLLDHIKDLEVEKPKVEFRLQEELKEATVKKAKVELRLEEELKEAVFFVDNNGTGATSNREDNVKGVEEGNVKVNATQPPVRRSWPSWPNRPSWSS